MMDTESVFLAIILVLANYVQLFEPSACGYPGSSLHSTLRFNAEVIVAGTIARYACDQGFELLGQPRRTCSNNGTWTPSGIPFCVLNVAAGKAPMQYSVAGGAGPEKAVDGSTSPLFNGRTCTMTKAEKEKAPWWYVNLLETYTIQLVRIDFGMTCCSNGREATIVVRVGNNRPDLGVNPVCNRFTGSIEEGRPLYLPCVTSVPGAFVSVHLEKPRGQPLSICEVFVYSDTALPIERCPSLRDQPLGGISTYGGKCYIFYDNQPKTFEEAHEFCDARGGTLVDETSPALQGFLSWELYRRHLSRHASQYWMGAIRDPRNFNNWKWVNGRDVSVSFWNQPGTNQNCSAFDGSKGWLWTDVDCNMLLNFICQHRPRTCGHPERPPNSTLSVKNFKVGSVVEYMCDSGHLLVGPNTRTCLSSGFYSQFPPSCRSDVTTVISTMTILKMNTTETMNEIRFSNPTTRVHSTTLESISKEVNSVPELGANIMTTSLETSSHGPFIISMTTSTELDFRIPPVLFTGLLYSTKLPQSQLEPNRRGISNFKKASGVSNKHVQNNGELASVILNTGGYIALGVFGGFILLVALISLLIIAIRRIKDKFQTSQSLDSFSGSTFDTSSGEQDLHKYYQRAWDNLRCNEKSTITPPLVSDKSLEQKKNYNNQNVYCQEAMCTLDKVRKTEKQEISLDILDKLPVGSEMQKQLFGSLSSLQGLAPPVHNRSEFQAW
ncbi:uncharacterized protein LOC143236845 isoform X2 [Tachypleus tridentatus]|uniref:uncharacterized protein LOC143236845 isoform X2 n=1 Tax=Tachypleus tridentatus TaxID=6853 RepID=UPI003FD544C3